jgi:hypothetical protein
MSISINTIIKAIVPINNRYRDDGTSTREKLAALWEMGDILFKMGVVKPHAIGWVVQRETRGLIKRPTIFRSHKIRSIWGSKEQLLTVLGNVRGLSNLTEMLPLLDPIQEARERLTGDEIDEIYHHACSEAPTQFKNYISAIKQKYSHGRLGQSLDKSKHLREFRSIVSKFRTLLEQFLHLIDQPEPSQRQRFRESTSAQELRALSNMCIALTTKDNFSLYRKLGPFRSSSKNEVFRELYDRFSSMLETTSDVDRARLRRVIAPETLAQMSDLVSSLGNESGVVDFRARQKITIRLYSGGGTVS